MRKLFVYLMIAASIISLVACAYETGIQVTDDTIVQVIDNKTTSDEVVKLIGYPPRKSQVGDKEIWYYDFLQINHIGPNTNETTAFEFNKKGIVTSHYKTGGNIGTSSNPLLRAAGQ